ncbi:MAG: L-histidine N(alpha)-methyltransferase [Gemmatimonadaceae bacterium]|nr:L-histidine N(alpha)-methyltransferase [Gemmatimonadaceae bacterium]
MPMPSPRHGVPRIAARPDARSVREEVLRGLHSEPKTLPPKLFYDAAGAALFERICELPEYYLTRAELEILRAHSGEIAALAGPRVALLEYGSGAGVKIRLLLDALESPAAYVPIDISREQLARVSRELAAEYPGVTVQPLAADYTLPLAVPTLPTGSRRVAFFPGSTIGNFHPMEAVIFLGRVRRAVGRNGALILGVDRRKKSATLNAAYDDAAGVTAEFNLNILERLNRDVGGHFDLGGFEHRAFFNSRASRVEMHLVSKAAQMVRVAGDVIDFEEGESIWTESSYKYDRARLEELIETAGFRLRKLWTNSKRQFWVAYLEAV